MTDLPTASLRILGSSGGFPDRGFPCSGYLYAHDGKRLLLDCGPGIATALLAESGKGDLDAVLISHLHSDHVLDLVPLAYSLLTEWMHEGRTKPLPLYMPTGGLDLLARLSGLFGHGNWRFPQGQGSAGQRALAEALANGQDWLLTVFNVIEYAPGDMLTVADLVVETAGVDHSLPTAAMKLGPAGRQVVYSADTRFTQTLVDFARGVRLLLIDAHLSGPKAPGGAHMSPADAGRLAALAEVETLVLCHLGAPEDGPSAMAWARQCFAGQIHYAFETREYEL